MKIVGISGSLRNGSHNTQLLHALSRLLPDGVDFEEATIDVPMFTHNETEFPDSVKELREKVRKADALIIACPEYNWNLTTALKNAIDWLSRGGADAPLNNHVVAIAGVGGGRLGSVRAQLSLRQTLLHNKVWTVPGPEVLIAPSDDMFDAQGNLTNEVATSLAQQLIDELVRVAPTLRIKN